MYLFNLYILSQLAWSFSLASLCLGLLFGYINRKLAIRYKILDDPKAADPGKRLQKVPIPYAGSGFILSSVFLIGIAWLIRKYQLFGVGDLLDNNLQHPFKLYWVVLAVLIMLVGGFLDDKFTLPTKVMFIPINLAILVTIFLGDVRITALSEPFNHLLPHNDIFLYLLTFLWIGFCLAATKFLDGMDGLVTTVGLISFLAIASVSLFSNVNQPLIFLFALVMAFGNLSFLFFNFPNAKAYLGEGASEIIGFLIGVFSILSGAKIATTSTVIGWFILDVVFVYSFRIMRKKPIFGWDRNHWHHRLLDFGLNKVQVLSLTAFILIASTHIGLLFPTQYKSYLFGSQLLLLFIIFAIRFIQEVRGKKVEIK